MKTHSRVLLLLAALLAATTFASPAAAATISLSNPGVVSGPFDIVVSVTDLFAGRSPDDFLFTFGFDVTVSDPTKVSFTGATSGSNFEAATTAPGTDVFAAALGFAIAPGVVEPLILATLHFSTIAPGTANIIITSDLANLFQGLQFLEEPSVSIGGTVPVTVATQTAVPEPTTLVLSGLGLIGVALRRRLARR